MVKRLQRMLRRLREQGPTLFVRARLLNARLFVLQRRYGFSAWHVYGTYLDEPYKAKAAGMIQSLHPVSVVEVGCGLGEILTRVPAAVRVGFDIDRGAVECARALHRKEARFFHGNFLDAPAFVSKLEAAGVDSIDVLVLLNWIHEVEAERILRSLGAVHARVPIRYVLLDAIKPGVEGCKYCHSLDDLGGFGHLIESVDADEVRSLYLFTLESFGTNQLTRLGQAIGSSTVTPQD